MPNKSVIDGKLSTMFFREGKPISCINCGGALHRKSEHYCSEKCAEAYALVNNESPPTFLSKWKLRKQKELNDPIAVIRNKTRRKSNELVKQGRIKKEACVVCGAKEVLIHHEDYDNPFKVIWLCEFHHKEYHEGSIGLFNNKLWWNPNRLVPKSAQNILNSNRKLKIKYGSIPAKIITE